MKVKVNSAFATEIVKEAMSYIPTEHQGLIDLVTTRGPGPGGWRAFRRLDHDYFFAGAVWRQGARTIHLRMQPWWGKTRGMMREKMRQKWIRIMWHEVGHAVGHTVGDSSEWFAGGYAGALARKEAEMAETRVSKCPHCERPLGYAGAVWHDGEAHCPYCDNEIMWSMPWNEPKRAYWAKPTPREVLETLGAFRED